VLLRGAMSESFSGKLRRHSRARRVAIAAAPGVAVLLRGGDGGALQALGSRIERLGQGQTWEGAMKRLGQGQTWEGAMKERPTYGLRKKPRS
jgi:hypothetical protein